MAPVSDYAASSKPHPFEPLVGFGSRTAASALRPASGAVHAAIGLERRVVERVLDTGELERIALAALNDTRVQAAIRSVLASDGAAQTVDSLFASGLIDRVIDRLLASDALWRLVDEVAQSPSVIAAVSQQGLGFADQIGRAARERSRKADDRVERTVGRLRRHQHTVDAAGLGVRES
jgi:hypothetical protein